MVEDLRHREELADRRAALDREGAEIALERFHLGEDIAQHRHRALAGEVERVVGVDPAADGVVELAGIHAEVNPAHAEPVRSHRGGKCFERDGAVPVGILRLCLQSRDDRRETGQLVGVVRRQPVRGGGERFGFGQVAGEVLGPRARLACRAVERGDEFVLAIEAAQRAGIAFQPLGLFRQPEPDRMIPFDVGPPVHVVADPAGEAERHWLERAPFLAPAIRRFA